MLREVARWAEAAEAEEAFPAAEGVAVAGVFPAADAPMAAEAAAAAGFRAVAAGSAPAAVDFMADITADIITIARYFLAAGVGGATAAVDAAVSRR